MSRRDGLGEFEQLVLLAVLRLGEDHAYGMKIQLEIEGHTGRSCSLGALYTTLDRLQEKGFVSSRTGDPTRERGGRAKKFFKVEAAGATACGSPMLQCAGWCEVWSPSLVVGSERQHPTIVWSAAATRARNAWSHPGGNRAGNEDWHPVFAGSRARRI